MTSVLTLPGSGENPSPTLGDALRRELMSDHGGAPLGPWGHVWAKKRQTVVLVPWDRVSGFHEAPLLFMDETYDPEARVFAYGLLAMSAGEALTTALWFLETLLRIRARAPSFWPRDSVPPRLHLRELSPPEARSKTPWHLLSNADTRNLLVLVLDVIRKHESQPFILPVEEDDMTRAIRLAFPDGIREEWIPDLRLQAAAIQFLILAESRLNPALTFEMVVDHDSGKIVVGPNRRQSSLRLRDVLLQTPIESQAKRPEIQWYVDRRYSSKFPADFTSERFQHAGYPLRPLVDSIGLQFIDVYLGLWRQVSTRGQSPFGISGGELGAHHKLEVKWLRPGELPLGVDEDVTRKG